MATVQTERWVATLNEIWAILMKVAQWQAEPTEQMWETDERLDWVGRQLGWPGDNFVETLKTLVTERRFLTPDEIWEILTEDAESIFGQMLKAFVALRPWEKFVDFPNGFERAYRRVQVFNGSEELTHIDILLSGGELVMAVEASRRVCADGVERHISRMGKIREFPPAEAKGKKLLGAIAGAVVDPDARDMAHKNGFFVIELTGDTAALAPRPQDFQPREW